jgi:glutamate-1-semialdehyde aminotransferase
LARAPSLGGGGSQGSGAPSPTPFKTEAELFKEGSAIRALGASTVDGQATVGFAGTLTAQRLAEGELSKKQLAKLKHEHLKLKGSFETFIAANGVPVHTTVVLSIGKLRMSTSSDVLAIDFPVTVPAPPPAAETIPAAELLKLETARLKRLLKKKHKHK